MTYEDYYGARLLVAERRYGAPYRAAVRDRERREDTAFDNTVALLRKAK